MRDSTRDSLCIHAIALTESAPEQPLRQLRLRGELSGWGPLSSGPPVAVLPLEMPGATGSTLAPLRKSLSGAGRTGERPVRPAGDVSERASRARDPSAGGARTAATAPPAAHRR